MNLWITDGFTMIAFQPHSFASSNKVVAGDMEDDLFKMVRGIGYDVQLSCRGLQRKSFDLSWLKFIYSWRFTHYSCRKEKVVVSCWYVLVFFGCVWIRYHWWKYVKSPMFHDLWPRSTWVHPFPLEPVTYENSGRWPLTDLDPPIINRDPPHQPCHAPISLWRAIRMRSRACSKSWRKWRWTASVMPSSEFRCQFPAGCLGVGKLDTL